MGTRTYSEEFFRNSVTKLEYVDVETLVSSSEDGTMRVWSVVTGAQKEELDGGISSFSKDNSSVHKVVKYSITFKDDLLLISEVTFTEDLLLISDQSLVSFFRAPHVISTITTTGKRIGVGCKNGKVLELRLDWLDRNMSGLPKLFFCPQWQPPRDEIY